MVWFIVFASIIALCGIIYLFLPMFKKLKNSKSVLKSKKEDKEVKKSIKQDKKQQKEDKKLERKLEKQEKSSAIEEKKFEDPDTKVIENNLDLDGFFNTDFSSLKKEEERESIKSSYDDIFDDMFSNEQYSFSGRKNDNYNFDDIDDAEINEFLEDDMFTFDKNNMSQMIKDLPPEIKAIMLSDVFDKKDI